MKIVGVKIAITIMNYHDQKQLKEERAYFAYTSKS